jgi:hypothetical protein
LEIHAAHYDRTAQLAGGTLQAFRLTLLSMLLLFTPLLNGDDKPTSLSAAQSAVDANLKTPEGKAFDQRMGTEFVQNHLAPLRQCKQSAGDDLTSFWMLLKLDKDGSVKELLLYPSTKLGSCARDSLLKGKFIPPPKPDYLGQRVSQVGEVIRIFSSKSAHA